MNMGMAFNKRPDQKAPSKTGGMSFKAMARQMGLDPEEMGEEAENMWAMLDDMSTNDPAAYKEFIAEQMEAKAEEEARPKEPHIMPNGCFVIKATDKHSKAKTFINVCCHEALERPSDYAGRPVSDDPRAPTDGVSVPMAIGAVRCCEDSGGKRSVAVDAIVHGWATGRAETDRAFKTQVADLIVKTVEQEHSLVLDRPFKLIAAKYKGGRGEAKSKPVAFLIDPKTGRPKLPSTEMVPVGGANADARSMSDYLAAQAAQAMASGGPGSKEAKARAAAAAAKEQAAAAAPKMQSPKDLMGMLGDLSDVDGVGKGGGASRGGLGDITMLGATKPAKPSGGPLIVDLAEEQATADASAADAAATADADGSFDISGSGSSAAGEAKAPPPTAKKKKVKPAVKKGFLNAKATRQAVEKAPLYPEGSNEGMKQHPWNSIMHKSKVIDLNQCTKEQQAKYSAGSRDPKDFEPGAGKEAKGVAEKEAQFSDADFERMMEKMEPDTFGMEASRRVAKERESSEEMSKWAEMFSKADGRIDGSMGAGGKGKEGMFGDKPNEPPQTKQEGEKQASEMLSMLGSLMGEGDAAKQAESMMKMMNTDGLVADQMQEVAAAAEAEAEAPPPKAPLREGTVDYSKFEAVDEDWDPEEEEQRKKRVEQKKRFDSAVKAKFERQAAEAKAAEAELQRNLQKGLAAKAEKAKAREEAAKVAKAAVKAAKAAKAEVAAGPPAPDPPPAKARLSAAEQKKRAMLRARKIAAAAKDPAKAKKQAAAEKVMKAAAKEAAGPSGVATAFAASWPPTKPLEEPTEPAEPVRASDELEPGVRSGACPPASEETAVAATQEEEEEVIMEIGADGTFDLDRPAVKKVDMEANLLKKGKERLAKQAAAADAKRKQAEEALATAAKAEAEAEAALAAMQVDAEKQRARAKEARVKAVADAEAARDREEFDFVDELAAEASAAAESAEDDENAAPQANTLLAPEFVVKRVKSKGTYKVTTHIKLVLQLPGLGSMASADLDISAQWFKLAAPGFGPLSLQLPELVQEDQVVAKFSKKKQQLTVTIPVREGS